MRIFLLLVVMGACTSVSAQYGCKDTLSQPDPYYQCALSVGGAEYNPVCGCDYVTYRNECAAIHWGGLNYWTNNTICGSFHFDLRPTAVEYLPVKFQAYIRNISNINIPISIYVYDAYGKLEYQWFDATSTDGLYPNPNPLEIPAHLFPRGIYSLIVVINGEKQYIKFAKVVES